MEERMIERVTIEIPAEFKEALRTERFERRTTYREIIAQMFRARYGLPDVPKQRKKKAEGSKAGA
jgi:hypothetical protein